MPFQAVGPVKFWELPARAQVSMYALFWTHMSRWPIARSAIGPGSMRRNFGMRASTPRTEKVSCSGPLRRGKWTIDGSSLNKKELQPSYKFKEARCLFSTTMRASKSDGAEVGVDSIWNFSIYIPTRIRPLLSMRVKSDLSAWSHFRRARLFGIFFRNVTFLRDIARKWEFHRSKTNKISIRSVKLPFSDNITQKSYVTKKLSQKVARDENGTKHFSGALHACLC